MALSFRDIAALLTFPLDGDSKVKVLNSGIFITVDKKGVDGRMRFLQTCLVGCFLGNAGSLTSIEAWAK